MANIQLQCWDTRVFIVMDKKLSYRQKTTSGIESAHSKWRIIKAIRLNNDMTIHAWSTK